MIVDISDLEPDAQTIIQQIVARMRVGQKQYGALVLKTDTRKFGKEATEEMLDGLVYLTIKHVQQEAAENV